MPYLSSEEFIKFCKKKRIALKKIDPELNEHKIVLKEVKSYQKLWKYLNYLVMLKPDSIKSHHEWRKQQEVQLRRKTKRGMTEEEINHFVEVFLPFTYLCYETVKPDFKILINKNHKNYLKL